MDRTDTQNEALSYFEGLASNDPSRPDVVRIDTHANVVFLVGSKAYKIKRAVQFPFLDYSTLALREDACKAEITFNRANAPEIYLRALPVTRQEDGSFALDGGGTPIEWAVEMNRFDRRNELDSVAANSAFSDHLSDQLAQMMVSAHAHAPLRKGPDFYAELATYVDQNDAAFHEHPELFASDEVHHLTRASRAALASIHDLILKRGELGLIRRCHGDAHLRNIVLIDGKLVLFDAVEFSDAIATNDILYDLAFLLMDLWERGQPRAANRVFNRYLDLSPLTENPEGLAALPFYLMMRAAIRSKIAAASALNQSDPALKAAQQAQAKTYFKYALGFLEPSQPELLAIGGLSGTGKTTLAYGLAPEIGRAPGARVLRTDVKRKKLLGLSETEKAPKSAYTKDASDKIYHAVDAEMQAVLAAGHSAIYDAVFAAEAERTAIEAVSARVEAGFHGLWLSADADTLKQRIKARDGDASDATAEIVDQQLTYDLGRMTWPQVDAGADADTVLRQAKAAL
ncbi:AAA family ATPase [Roseibium sp.]|uniref:bifunctional aminoglycoside phosphotransferase/ATP-binding protein n=1 Tax=Roseibium sp. TaxID=1936156 RepID=UPI003B5188F9